MQCGFIDRYLTSPNVSRECPGTAALAQSFRIEVTRRQRRSDGTVSLSDPSLPPLTSPRSPPTLTLEQDNNP